MTHHSGANTVQTLDRGLQILELLVKSEQGPTALARAIGVDRSVVHRILRTLMQRGYVERGDTTGSYRINLSHLLALTGELTSRQEQNWLTIAKSYLEELRAATGLAANLCIPSGNEMVYLLRVFGDGELTVNNPPGTRRPLYCSAIGKAYLGALPEPELDVWLSRAELKSLTPQTITSIGTLKEHLLESRAKGYYIDDREFHPRIRCVAAPILDQFGRPIASIGISGPQEVLSCGLMAEFGALVVDKARKISILLGYTAEQMESRDTKQSTPLVRANKRSNRLVKTILQEGSCR